MSSWPVSVGERDSLENLHGLHLHGLHLHRLHLHLHRDRLHVLDRVRIRGSIAHIDVSWCDLHSVVAEDARARALRLNMILRW